MKHNNLPDIDAEKLEKTITALQEARDIVERAWSVARRPCPGLDSLCEGAYSRYLARASRYPREPSSDAEQAAVRTAVEPIARAVVHWQKRDTTTLDDLECKIAQFFDPDMRSRMPDSRLREVLAPLWASSKAISDIKAALANGDQLAEIKRIVEVL